MDWDSINEKAELLSELKREKDAIAAAITVVETELIRLVGSKTEGRTKLSGESFSVMTTGKLTRKLDLPIWESIKEKIPVEMHPVKVKTELDLTKLKKVKELSPANYKEISRAITETPAKTAVNVEEILKCE